jgi:hypothetical protein
MKHEPAGRPFPHFRAATHSGAPAAGAKGGKKKKKKESSGG